MIHAEFGTAAFAAILEDTKDPEPLLVVVQQRFDPPFVIVEQLIAY